MIAQAQDMAYVSTRYPGSKRRLAPWILAQTKDIQFSSVLDAFGGTGSVSYAFKRAGKQVTYNDILKSSYYAGLALIENSRCKLTDEEVTKLLSKDDDVSYPTFIRDTFRGIYFTDEENAWLDTVVTNIGHMTNRFKRALAFHALFQSCLIKRPFNSFHRRNLYLRLAQVERNFHNHTTWERPFEQYFKKFSTEANACVFDNGKSNVALNLDVFKIRRRQFDLVYVDAPYISAGGTRVNYYRFYNFLEGLCQYNNWGKELDYKSKYLISKPDGWAHGKKTVKGYFKDLFEKFQDSALVVSYRISWKSFSLNSQKTPRRV